ncbi:MAG: hypothetical protein NTW35_00770 [Candidatus Nomurabacteria bacterium]|nr:hypothetical protein [Candidatus Nomurabacteria bacterium]
MTNLDQPSVENIPASANEQVSGTQEGGNEDRIKQIDKLFEVGQQILVELEKRVGPVTTENNTSISNLLDFQQWDAIFTGPLQDRERPNQKAYMTTLVEGRYPGRPMRGDVDSDLIAADKDILGKLKYE